MILLWTLKQTSIRFFNSSWTSLKVSYILDILTLLKTQVCDICKDLLRFEKQRLKLEGTYACGNREEDLCPGWLLVTMFHWSVN